jgi:hypothetical protein
MSEALFPARRWLNFVARHPHAHLVSAAVVPIRSPRLLKRLQTMIEQLIRQHGPSDFSTCLVSGTDGIEILCAFVHRSDADLLARLADAAVAPAREGWASHRSFKLSAAREVALAGMLAPQDPRGAG